MSLPAASLQLSILTSGLYPSVSPYTPMLTGGYGINLAATLLPLNPYESDLSTLKKGLIIAGQTSLDLVQALTGFGMPMLAPDGQTLGSKPVGGTPVPFTRPTVTSAASTKNSNGIIIDEVVSTYAGGDIRLLIELASATTVNPSNISNAIRKVLLEAASLSISIHRIKAPVRACGYIGAKAYARGNRTVAGTIVLTQFSVDVLFRFLEDVLANDMSKDTSYAKVDQLPPFNITLLMSDEYGNESYRRLLGVDFVTDGTVYSIHDLLSEQSVSYVASDFTPLLPMTSDPVLKPYMSTPGTDTQKTPGDIIRSKINYANSKLLTPVQGMNFSSAYAAPKVPPSSSPSITS